MGQALQKHCGDVTFLGPIEPLSALVAKIFSKALLKTIGKNYLYTHSTWLSKKVAKIAERKLSSNQFDLVFAPAGSTEIAYLETKLPIIYLSDTTVSLISNYYPEFSNVLTMSLREAEHIEQLAIGKAASILYPSWWAARSAIDHYLADEKKVRVVPFGANLEEVPDRDVVLGRRRSQRCQLLFVGVDWERKGGEIAFGTMLALERAGVPADLTIVGCVPPKEFTHKNVKVIPFLNKNNLAERSVFSSIFLQSDFLVLPTRMECTAIAFCEASAFGLPIMATDTGGVAGAVTNGDNGYLFSSSASAENYAEMICRLYSEEPLYRELRKKCRNAFEQRLNWGSWAKTVRETIVAVV
jgi:glycosyltransferase involved in cell wall biosynthesis